MNILLAYCPIHRVPIYPTNRGNVACIRCEKAKRNGGEPTPAEKREQKRQEWNAYHRNYYAANKKAGQIGKRGGSRAKDEQDKTKKGKVK